jgi:hypothetical protein
MDWELGNKCRAAPGGKCLTEKGDNRMKTSASASRIVPFLIVVSALITAAVHLFLGLRNIASPFGIVFVLNALGFAGLTTLYLLPLKFLNPYRALVRWGLIGFSAITFILYFVFNGLKIDGVSGITKAAELALIGLLLADRGRR